MVLSNYKMIYPNFEIVMSVIDDSTLIFTVVKIEGNIYLKALNEGYLRQRQYKHTRGCILSRRYWNDIVDIKFGVKNDVDFIALSFASTKEDILKLEI